MKLYQILNQTGYKLKSEIHEVLTDTRCKTEKSKKAKILEIWKMYLTRAEEQTPDHYHKNAIRVYKQACTYKTIEMELDNLILFLDVLCNKMQNTMEGEWNE